MRRPLVILFLCFSSGSLFCWYGQDRLFSVVLAVLLSAVLIAAAAMILRTIRKRGTKAGKSGRGTPSVFELRIPPTVILGIAAFLAGVIVMGAELWRPEPLLQYVGEDAVVTGQVVSEKQTEYGRSLVLRPQDGSSRRRIWVYVNDSGTGGTGDNNAPENEEPWTGKILEITGTVKEPSGPRNPGGFDQKTYLRTLGAQVVLEAESGGILVLDDSVEVSARFRHTLQRRWMPVMGERSCGGLMSLLFGASDMMEEETLDAFQRIGLGHLLAVSGLHVGLVYGAVQKLLGDRGKTLAAQVICGLAAVGYAGLAGFSASASRAALMIVIHGIGRTIYRPYDMTTSASLAGMCVLMRQPCQIMSSGFQLSFLAAFGLACVLPRISYSLELWADRGRSHVRRKLAETTGAMAAIQLVMTPVSTRRFHCFSLWSLVLNPLCIAGAGLLIPMAMGLAVVTMLTEMVFGAGAAEMGYGEGVLTISAVAVQVLETAFFGLARLTGAVMEGMMNLGELAAALPGTFTTVGFPPGLLLLYYCGLFTWSSESFYLLLRRGRRRMAAGWLAAALIFCHVGPWWAGAASSPALFSYEQYPLVFVDVGQGDCIHLHTPDGKNVLIDGGGSTYKNVGKDTILPYLLYSGVKTVDLALVTHLHMDHFQGLAELSEEVQIKRLGVYESNRYRSREELGNAERIVYLKEGSSIELEDDIWIDVLSPPERSEAEYRALAEDDSDENESSLIFMIHYEGTKILVTGDLGFEGERRLMERYGDELQADVLKIGHHGSKYSTSEGFLEAVDPDIAVIQVGTNFYGHPSTETLKRLESRDITVLRNDQLGAVCFRRKWFSDELKVVQ